MIKQKEVVLQSFKKGFHLITEQIIKEMGELPKEGLLHLFIQHTSAALSVNENADPTVRKDLDRAFDRIAPEGDFYAHDDEGADDMPAHIKTVIAGSSVTIPISGHQLNLGRWQGIYLCEFRLEASARSIVATVFS